MLRILYDLLQLDAAYQYIVKTFTTAAENGLIPDFVLRRAIRYLLSLRKKQCDSGTLEQQYVYKQNFVSELKRMPVAINTDAANEQHYEVPTDYYLLCLGKHLKYSSCYYKSPMDSLNQAEHNMLVLYCQRAELQDGQDILELGCGWGSFSLFAAQAFPKSKITAVSNSKTQKEFILGQCRTLGITNLQVITANMIDFQAPATYDRVISIEMFEHMKNYQELMRRISLWLKPSGKLFVHIFVHRTTPYHFTAEREEDWMSKYFFTGGTMPSADLLLYFQDNLAIEHQWWVNGRHYSRTLEAWLQRQDTLRHQVMGCFEDCYGGKQAFVWFMRWRIFYIACSELFNFNHGEEWAVCHYLFKNKA